MFTMNIYLRLIVLILIIIGLVRYIRIQIKSIQEAVVKQKKESQFKDHTGVDISKKYALIGLFIVIIIILSTMFFLNFESILYKIVGG